MDLEKDDVVVITGNHTPRHYYPIGLLCEVTGDAPSNAGSIRVVPIYPDNSTETKLAQWVNPKDITLVILEGWEKERLNARR